MDPLRVRGERLVDAAGRAVWLRGVCVGGWMNLESFINGHPGAEHMLRRAMAEALGPSKAAFFFERLLDHVLADDDLAFIKACGANVVRLPLNYHHFEDDAAPGRYREEGFARLERTVRACAAHGLYAILDLHAVPGCQSPDWHCDNAHRQALFWRHPHFQDRFVALWRALAERFAGVAAVAGYNVMNEPVSGAPNGRVSHDYTPDWAQLNAVNRRVVAAIREVDREHPIWLEGDCFSTRFDGLDAPFEAGLAYSSHNYTPAGFGPGPYPGSFEGRQWNGAAQRAIIEDHQGTRFARRHRVPLWAGEFGSVYNGLEAEWPDRLRAVDDEMAALNALGLHWTMWTYKDIGAMGWVRLDPRSEYMERTAALRQAKAQLSTDFWMTWMPQTPARRMVADLAQQIAQAGGGTADGLRLFLEQAALDNFAGAALQPAYAKAFAGLSEAELDRILQSFALARCVVRQPLVDRITARLAEPIGAA
jgi:aryl-phospho-beta-D-glucosidase BglC (GH1 family)